MDVKVILANLQALARITTELQPGLAAIGIPSGTIDLVNAGIKIANEVKTAIDNGKAIAEAKEQAEVQNLITSLQARADALSAAVDAT